jgi:hypothetical protein
LLTQQHLDRLWAHLPRRFDGCRGSFPGVKWPACDVGHSAPARAEVETEWSHAFTTSTGQATFVRSDGLTGVNIRWCAVVRQTGTTVPVDNDAFIFRTLC